MTWKLIIEDDAGKQIVVPFTRDVITIGRKEGNTIRLTERNVSRNHAKLSKDNGHVVVEDLKSFNGIKLNGDRIDGRVHVHEGDTIQIGDYHLALHAQEGANAGAAGDGNGIHATQPLRRDAAAQGQQADDDEFAGDTQRWEPPQGGPALSVAGLATTEDRALSDELTVPQPGARGAAQAPPLQPQATAVEKNGFGADSGDTERVSMDLLEALKSPSSSGAAVLPTRRPEVELEPTVRQQASPPPITMPPAPAVQAKSDPPAPAAAVQPTSAMPQIGGHVGVLETKPEPRVQEPKPQLPTQPVSVPSVAPRTPALEAKQVTEEQTEAIRASPGAEDVMYPRLVVLNTIFAGSTFSLRAAEAVMGRTEDNDITIEHKSVSRNHAKVVREGDRVRILDLKSANGVLVNNEECEQAVLRAGDVVELGRVKLRFVPIGERFTVAPDEIERARIADAAGDDFESDAGTGVTNPVRKKQPVVAQSASFDTFPPPAGRPNIIFIAGGVIVILLIIAVLVIVFGGGTGEEKVEVTPPPPPVAAVPVAPIAPPTPTKVDPPPLAPVPVVADATPPPPEDTAKVEDVKLPDAKVEDTPPSNDGGSGKSRPNVRKDKPDPAAAVKTAKSKIIQGDYGGAVSDLAPFVKSDNAEVHRTLGVAYAKLKNNELARRHYRKYLELEPDAQDAAQVKAILEGPAK